MGRFDENNNSTGAGRNFKGLGIIVGIILAVTLFIAYCSLHRVNVDGGNVAVLIKKPFFFGHGGVENATIAAGSTWVAGSTEHIIVPVFPREFPEQFNDMNTADNFPVHFETNLQLQIIAAEAATLIEKFGVDWYNNNIKQKFREIIRDEVGQQHMTPLVTRSPKLELVQKNVSTKIAAYIESINLPVRFIRVTFSQIDPHAKVIQERADTAQQQQRIQTETQRKLAEDNRKMAEEAKAVADLAYSSKMGLTPEQFVRLETAKISERMVEKAKSNITFVIGGGIQPSIPVGR